MLKLKIKYYSYKEIDKVGEENNLPRRATHRRVSFFERISKACTGSTRQLWSAVTRTWILHLASFSVKDWIHFALFACRLKKTLCFGLIFKLN